MKFKILLIAISLLITNNISYAAQSDSTQIHFALGISGGIVNKAFGGSNQLFISERSISGEAYGSMFINNNHHKIECSAGYHFFRGQPDFFYEDDFYFNSHNLFIQGNYYLTPDVFVGLRQSWNLNTVDYVSQKGSSEDYGISSETFAGVAGFLVLGYHKNITPSLSLKVQGQIGFHTYTIGDGINISFPEDFIMIGHSTINILYGINVGLVFRIP